MVQLSAGQFHTGFVAEDGSVWMWGWGLYGQLGMGSRSIRDHLVPKRVEGLRYALLIDNLMLHVWQTANLCGLLYLYRVISNPICLLARTIEACDGERERVSMSLS